MVRVSSRALGGIETIDWDQFWDYLSDSLAARTSFEKLDGRFASLILGSTRAAKKIVYENLLREYSKGLVPVDPQFLVSIESIGDEGKRQKVLRWQIRILKRELREIEEILEEEIGMTEDRRQELRVISLELDRIVGDLETPPDSLVESSPDQQVSEATVVSQQNRSSALLSSQLIDFDPEQSTQVDSLGVPGSASSMVKVIAGEL